MANFLLEDAGADIIIGGHPHVIQPFQLTKDNKFIAYSLGNFISHQRGYSKYGMLLKLVIAKYSDGKIMLESVKPHVLMEKLSPVEFNNNNRSYTLFGFELIETPMNDFLNINSGY